MNNQTLAKDIDSIKALVPRRSVDTRHAEPYLITVADNDYHFTTEESRDSDYQKVLTVFQTYQLRNTETGEEVDFTVAEILEEINRDRTDTFLPYTTEDWRDGLSETEYELVEDRRLLQILPFGIVVGEDESDVALWWASKNICERQTSSDIDGLCDTAGIYYGTSDSQEKKLCARHFYQGVKGGGIPNYRLSQ